MGNVNALIFFFFVLTVTTGDEQLAKRAKGNRGKRKKKMLSFNSTIFFPFISRGAKSKPELRDNGIVGEKANSGTFFFFDGTQ